MKLGILASHPIQYQAPLFQALAEELDLKVYFAHHPTPQDQAKAGFGVEFEWDLDLLTGYSYKFLKNISRHPSTQSFFGCNTPDIAYSIQKEKFDAFIVMGWNLLSFWQTVVACLWSKTPIYVRGDSQLLTSRSWRVKLTKKIIYPLLLKLFHGFFVVGTRNREYLRYYGVPEDKIFTCPHFIDNERFEKDSRMTTEEKTDMRQSLGFNPNTPLCLFVGKFISRKRVMDIIQAMISLNEKEMDLQAMFIGSGELQPLMEQTIKNFDVRAKIIGFVNQKKLPQYYSIADFLILPSDNKETWGLVVNEAMACGIPAIVSDQVGCAPDLIEKGKTGMIYSCGDIKSLCNAIETLLDQWRFQKEYIQKSLRIKMDLFSVHAAVNGIKEALYMIRFPHSAGKR